MIRKFWLAVAVIVPLPALAAGTLDAPAKPAVAEAKMMVDRQEYSGAIALLRQIVATEPRNADAFNLLGYSYRKTGQLADAKQHYLTALQLNPRHLGAHEYIGELYVQTGDLAAAERHLNELAALCSRSCEEYRDLEAAIARRPR